MKFTIDTEQKVIEVNEAVNIAELIDKLKEILGKDWKNYRLEQQFQWTYYPYIPYQPVIYHGDYQLSGTCVVTTNDSNETWVHSIQN